MLFIIFERFAFGGCLREGWQWSSFLFYFSGLGGGCIPKIK
jgi:hypothetical protein